MNKHLEQVKEFMTVFGQEVKEKPEFPNEKIALLRVSLLAEEVEELAEAVKTNDMKGVFDALLDIQYVLDGALLAFGLANIAEEGFDAVHNSNMLKLCTTHEEALATQKKYTDEGVMTLIHQADKYFLVKRLSDAKILKSINWKEQDLVSILNKATKDEE